MMTKWVGRFGTLAISVLAALAWAGVASAHVDVEADPPIAGAANALVTFTAEAESASAGITSVRVILPAGLSNSNVSLHKAPAGWRLSATSDGYSVGGASLPPGAEAAHSIIVSRLPDTNALVFKTLVNYSDGQVDRWIEEPSNANPNPGSPAPVLQLQPGPRPGVSPTTQPAVTTTVTPSITPAPATAAPATAPAQDQDGGGSTWVWWLVTAAVVGAVGAGTWYAVARRRS
jgi:uncharacterized protein YcnI